MKKVIAATFIAFAVGALSAAASTAVLTACGNSPSGSAVSTPLSVTSAVQETTNISEVSIVSESAGKAVKAKGISIALPDDFSEASSGGSEDTEVVFSNKDDTIAIFVVKELKSEFADTEVKSADDYLELQRSMNYGFLNSVINEENGVKYYEYNSTETASDKQETQLGSDYVNYSFFNVAKESEDAFWLVQFCCETKDYESNKENFMKWSETVDFY